MNPQIRRTIVIGGGVGPMAGVALHRYIIELTETDGRDQSHLSVLHVSRSREIPDRTEFLLGIDPRDPGIAMAEVVASAAIPAALGVAGEDIPTGVVGVPCNTFHTPSIVESFRATLAQCAPHLLFVDMMTETLAAISRRFSPGCAVGVLSTTGTRRAGVWTHALGEAGYPVLQVPEHAQEALHDGIYNRTWGLKAVAPPTEPALVRITEMADLVVTAGAEILLVACTELPFAIPAGTYRGLPVIDPVRELARGLITAAGGGLSAPTETETPTQD